MTLQKFMTDRVFGDRKSDSFSGIGSFKQFVSQMLRHYVIASSHGPCHPSLILIKIF